MRIRQQSWWMGMCGLAGATAVAMGAWAAHGMASRLPPEAVAIVQLAVQYQLWHALALGLVVVLAQRAPCSRSLCVAGWAFVAGLWLFCGSLYLLALAGVKALGWLTPCGGLALMLGWVCLLVHGVTAPGRGWRNPQPDPGHNDANIG